MLLNFRDGTTEPDYSFEKLGAYFNDFELNDDDTSSNFNTRIAHLLQSCDSLQNNEYCSYIITDSIPELSNAI